MTTDLRTTQLHFMVTPSEAEFVRDQAAKRRLTLSSYLRQVAFQGGALQATLDARELHSAYVELRRVGTNLNQISKNLNSLGRDGADSRQVKTAALAVERATVAISEEMAKARKLTRG